MLIKGGFRDFKNSRNVGGTAPPTLRLTGVFIATSKTLKTVFEVPTTTPPEAAKPRMGRYYRRCRAGAPFGPGR